MSGALDGGDPLAVSDRVVALSFQYEPRLPHLRHNLCGGTGMRPTGQGGLAEKCGCDGGMHACTSCWEAADRVARSGLIAGEPGDVIVEKAAAARCRDHGPEEGR